MIKLRDKCCVFIVSDSVMFKSEIFFDKLK